MVHRIEHMREEKVEQTLFVVDTVDRFVLIYLSTKSKRYSKIQIFG